MRQALAQELPNPNRSNIKYHHAETVATGAVMFGTDCSLLSLLPAPTSPFKPSFLS